MSKIKTITVPRCQDDKYAFVAWLSAQGYDSRLGQDAKINETLCYKNQLATDIYEKLKYDFRNETVKNYVEGKQK